MKAIKYKGRTWIPATGSHTIERPFALDADAQAEQINEYRKTIERISHQNKQFSAANQNLTAENQRLRQKISGMHFEIWQLANKYKAELVITKAAQQERDSDE